MKDFDKGYEVRVAKRDANGELVTDEKGKIEMDVFEVSREERRSRACSFRIGGETFEYRPSVPPEAILEWSKMTAGELPELTEEQGLEVYDRTILAFLTAGQEEKWRKVRAVDSDDPLTLGDMSALVRWLFEEQTGRPTPPSSPSTNGSASTGTTTGSTESSSSTAVPA